MSITRCASMAIRLTISPVVLSWRARLLSTRDWRVWAGRETVVREGTGRKGGEDSLVLCLRQRKSFEHEHVVDLFNGKTFRPQEGLL